MKEFMITVIGCGVIVSVITIIVKYFEKKYRIHFGKCILCKNSRNCKYIDRYRDCLNEFEEKIGYENVNENLFTFEKHMLRKVKHFLPKKIKEKLMYPLIKVN